MFGSFDSLFMPSTAPHSFRPRTGSNSARTSSGHQASMIRIAAAIRIMDAWWPLLVRAEFEPVLGRKLWGAVEGMNKLSNDPNIHGQHLGSAWQSGWDGYVIKDRRTPPW